MRPFPLQFEHIAIMFIFLVLGVGFGVYVQPYFSADVGPTDIREFNSRYRFVRPLLSCGVDTDITNDQASSLESELKKVVEVHETAGDVSDVSVYFKDFHGPWVGVNETESFSPGSLLKVPLAMSVYRKAEADPSFLRRTFAYSGEEAANDEFFKATPLAKGSYTVEELVSEMLMQSDNNAAHVLANTVGTADFQATYDSLGVQKPPAEGGDYTTTTKAYASFFYILYSTIPIYEPPPALPLMDSAASAEHL
jgi:beta-lactamase class A